VVQSPAKKGRSPFCLDDEEEELPKTIQRGLAPLVSPRSRFCIDEDGDDYGDLGLIIPPANTTTSSSKSGFCIDDETHSAPTTPRMSHVRSPHSSVSPGSRYCVDENEENGVMFPESSSLPSSSSLRSDSAAPSTPKFPPLQLTTIHPPKKYKGDSPSPRRQEQPDQPPLHSLSSPCVRTKPLWAAVWILISQATW